MDMNDFPDRPEVPSKPEGYKAPGEALINAPGSVISPPPAFGAFPVSQVKVVNPGLFEIDPKADSFKIEFGLKVKENRWIVIEKEKIDKLDKNIQKHWVEFKMWSFDEEVELKKKAMIYNESKRMHFVDHDILNEMKVRRLLKDWSFKDKNENLKIFHVNGWLVDESWGAFKNLHINICRYIIVRMNDILEYND